MTTIDDRLDRIRELHAAAEDAEREIFAEREILAEEVKVGARVLARKVAQIFRRLPTEITDEPGHSDSSYPPEEHTAAWTSEKYLLVRDVTVAEKPTSSGGYYSYSISTETPGLAIARSGSLVAILETGSAALGQYAAHPGTDSRDITREYRSLSAPSLGDLREAAELVDQLIDALRSQAPRTRAPEEADPDVLICETRNPAVGIERLREIAAKRKGRVKQAAQDAIARREKVSS